MVCSACGRKVDPERSFCRHCGSAVFIDEGESRRRQMRGFTPADRPVEQPAAAPAVRPRPVRSPSVDQVRRATPSARAATGCVASLVRLLIFGAIVWYVGRWLLAIPEVQTLVNAFKSGSLTDDQINAAFTAIRDHVLQLLGS